MNTKTLATILSLTAAAAVLPMPVYADGCNGQYGTTQYGSGDCDNVKVTINKEVMDPKTNGFVENLGSAQAFAPGAEVVFRITVTNTGNTPVTTVTVSDFLPPYLSFEAGPGTYNATTKTLTFDVGTLEAGKSHSELVLATVDTNTSTPATFCVTNKVEVKDGDSDTAQVCIEVKKVAVSTLPVAGVESFAMIVPFLGVAGAGLALIGKKK